MQSWNMRDWGDQRDNEDGDGVKGLERFSGIMDRLIAMCLIDLALGVFDVAGV